MGLMCVWSWLVFGVFLYAVMSGPCTVRSSPWSLLLDRRAQCPGWCLGLRYAAIAMSSVASRISDIAGKVEVDPSLIPTPAS